MNDRMTDARQRYWSRSAILAGAVAFLVVLIFGEYFCRTEAARERAVVRNRTLIAAASIRSKLEADLSATLYLGIGLSGYLSLNPTLNPAIVDPLLETIQSHGKFVRNIGLAPNNRLDYIYPLKGNEAAIGLRFEDLPTQWPDVKRAMETRETVTVGPIELVQGGIGIITRTPVFLQDDSYWGIISIVVELDALLENRRDESQKEFDTVWAMRTQTNRLDTPRTCLATRICSTIWTRFTPLKSPGQHGKLRLPPTQTGPMTRAEFLSFA